MRGLRLRRSRRERAGRGRIIASIGRLGRHRPAVLSTQRRSKDSIHDKPPLAHTRRSAARRRRARPSPSIPSNRVRRRSRRRALARSGARLLAAIADLNALIDKGTQHATSTTCSATACAAAATPRRRSPSTRRRSSRSRPRARWNISASSTFRSAISPRRRERGQVVKLCPQGCEELEDLQQAIAAGPPRRMTAAAARPRLERAGPLVRRRPRRPRSPRAPFVVEG
jgi:hypothetical protein